MLVLSGALLAGFVAFLIYGTGIETRIEQRRLLDELEFMTVADVPSPAGRTVPILSHSLEQRLVADIGDPIGQLSIPKIDAEWVFVSGVGVNELRLGPGHFPDSSMPGDQGNTAIAGHRISHGAPFARIDEINPGDEIILTTSSGIHRYTSVGTAIVGPADYAEISTQWPTVPHIEPRLLSSQIFDPPTHSCSCRPRGIRTSSDLAVDRSNQSGDDNVRCRPSVR